MSIAISKNWESLADHMQTKVRQREQNISLLHTKAGFMLTAIAVIAQLIPSKLPTDWSKFLVWTAAVLISAGFVTSLISLFINKSVTAPDGDVIGKYLLQHPDMSKNEFQEWLAESYQAAYEEFEKIYTKKDDMIRLSAIFVALALGSILTIRIT